MDVGLTPVRMGRPHSRPECRQFARSGAWTAALDAACRPARPDGTPDPDAPRLTKRPRVHDVRHTHASWMLAAGTGLFVLQRRLGPESITTTTETYAHLMPDQQKAPPTRPPRPSADSC